MRKIAMVFLLVAVAFGLCACGRDVKKDAIAAIERYHAESNFCEKEGISLLSIEHMEVQKTGANKVLLRGYYVGKLLNRTTGEQLPSIIHFRAEGIMVNPNGILIDKEVHHLILNGKSPDMGKFMVKAFYENEWEIYKKVMGF